ncbi:MAG TPA: peptidylprolyl isomerase, partial [Vicinamibacteria bacterium]|nr:peptidylprolyl isomerase [Vicinamibacteria bacterium]
PRESVWRFVFIVERVYSNVLGYWTPMRLRLALGLSLIPVASFAQPTLPPIGDIPLSGGSPLLLVLDAESEGPLTYAVESSDPLVTATLLTDNRSLRMQVAGFGEMVFELFDFAARRATDHIVQLADSGFYDGVVFHRVIDNFVIQGGDPTGAGGSPLGEFDDQFHVDLQHNRTGILSMAKTSLDDSSDSQFFITEGAQRNLDFNYTIFGILVEGESVRQAISGVPVGFEDRPLTNVVIEQARSFLDEENAVVLLKAPEGATGAADLTVVVRDAAGQETRQTVRVNVTPDNIDSAPFLADIPEQRTAVDTAISYQLQAIDVEGTPANFLDQTGLAQNGLAVPVQADANLQYRVDFNTGLLTITPTNGLSGRHFLTVATGVSVNAVDYQVVPVLIEP